VDSYCYAIIARWTNIAEQFLDNGSVNTFPRQRIRNQQSRYCFAITVEKVFSMWCVSKCYESVGFQRGQLADGSVRESVKENLSAGSWRIYTVRSRCQGTVGENTAGLKRHSGCCDYLWIVEISGGDLFACSSESVWCKWSINPFTNPNPTHP
jgi:hypothetical protein